ncbi:MAG: hypothetical protein COA79_05845 [Planctomycetota bacterium]|nr:MAG: hypothetical protein COA79_05845 [Planctomycetota bacterium]
MFNFLRLFMKPKILIFLNHSYSFWKIKQEDFERVQNTFSEFEVIVAFSKEETEKHIMDATIYYGWYFPENWVDQVKNLKWIHTPAAGKDYIYSKALEESSIEFTNSYGYHGLFMAQHAIGMILYFARGFQYCHKEFWPREDVANKFFDLIGSKLLIVGCGSIGEKIASLASHFGIEVYGYRRSLPKNSDSEIKWVSESNLKDTFAVSDIIIDLLPANENTFNYFDQEKFSWMNKNTLFMNLGRGKTVDEEALFESLKSNKLLGCGLDVLNDETQKSEHPLYSLPNVLITPHSSAFSQQYLGKSVDLFIEKLHEKKVAFV